jgi:hemolysin D
MPVAEGVMRAFSIARAAWTEDRKKAKARPDRRRDELEFLPAAVEVMETPVSPVGRFTAWTIMALIVGTLIWATIGTLDVVAIAQGRVVATGRSKVVQPLEAGVIRAIHVTDGKVVQMGDLIIELDPTQTTADRGRLAADLMAARVEAARLQASLTDDPERAFAPPAGSDAMTVATQRALLLSQVAEHRARVAALDDEMARRRSDRAAIGASIAKFERTIPLVRERATARTTLAEKGYSSRLQALEVQQQLVEQEQELVVARHRAEEISSALRALDQQRQQLVAEYRKTSFVALSDTEKRISGLTQELLKADQRQEQQTLLAPIDGVVQQLAVHTVGGVVTPAQQLMVIAPRDEPLEVEATFLNRDIGFIEPGQSAEIKLETFLFTKYGTIPGRVVSVSRDAVQDEKQGLVYPARIALDKATIEVNGRTMTLGAGMAVTVEVKTESRRLIEYLLSPILRYRSESLHER